MVASPYSFRSAAPPAHAHRCVGAPLDLGVRALNTFRHLPRPAHVLLSMLALADQSGTGKEEATGLPQGYQRLEQILAGAETEN
jgi:hypothetical protein